MNKISLTDTTSKLLEKVLDLRSTNQNVISSNIANSETPGYSPTRFEFENELKNAMGKTDFSMTTSHQNHIPPGATSISTVNGSLITTKDKSGIGDENGVNVDMEMIALSENQILYETAAQLLKKKMTLLKYVVQGGQ
ncbi:MAG: flagellar basal body rod protein FlgB [Bacteroidetes bacterium]|nr:flagellar basal body rod protein FlgB [Bacteroidota bacterium]